MNGLSFSEDFQGDSEKNIENIYLIIRDEDRKSKKIYIQSFR